MRRPRRDRSAGCDIDMTPMIDVVFQLIIFFIVTMKMEQDYNPDIILDMAIHGPAIEDQDPRTSIIEVDRRGWISVHGAQLSGQQLYNIVKRKFDKYGPYPILIRGDSRAPHQYIRNVMDICTSVGIWRINFCAIKEKKT